MSVKPARPNRLAASFTASAVRPAPPLDDEVELSGAGTVDRPRPAAPTPPASTPPVAPAAVRIKQTVELPEDVYEALQDFARARRTSFQVVVRALIDDVLSAEDAGHHARLDALVSAAEQAKRERRRNRRAPTPPAA